MDNKKTLWINIVCIFLYAIFTLIVVLNHEVWRDEAQVWVLLRDTNFIEMIKLVRTEGHPLLWYFLVFPLTRIFEGFNAVMSMQILNWLIVLLGVGVFLFKSPFNIYTKIAVMLSSGFLYWYPVIARSYCLIPILIFLLAMLYPKQKEHPYWYAITLIALANTHIIMFGFCSAVALVFGINNLKEKKNYPAIGIIFASLLSVVAYLWGTWNENLTVQSYIPKIGIQGLQFIYSNFLKSLYWYVNSYLAFFFSIFLIILSCVLAKEDKKLFFIFVSSLVFQFIVYVYFWGTLPQRSYTLILISLFLFWNLANVKNNFSKIFNLCFIFVLIFSTVYGVKCLIKDYFYEYSTSKKTAEYIIKQIPPNSFILTNDPFFSVSVSAYIAQNKTNWKFYSEKYNNYYTYIQYNLSNSFEMPLISDLSQFLCNEEIYVLLSRVYFEDVKPLWESNLNVESRETYKIYKVSNSLLRNKNE